MIALLGTQRGLRLTQSTNLPKLDTFDEAEFDCNPFWQLAAAPLPAILIVDDDPAIANLLGD